MSIPAKRYNEVVEALGWKVPDVATFFDVTVRTVFRWQAGTSPVPVPVAMLLELMVAGKASPGVSSKDHRAEGHQEDVSDPQHRSLMPGNSPATTGTAPDY